MWSCACLRRCVYRKLLSFILFTYVVVIFLFLAHLHLDLDGKEQDIDDMKSTPWWKPGQGQLRSPSVPDKTSRRPRTGHFRWGGQWVGNSSWTSKVNEPEDDVELVYGDSLKPKQKIESERDGYIFVQRQNKKPLSFLPPSPVPAPMVNIDLSSSDSGSFIEIGRDTFVYSAFVDDRREQTYIRIITLMSKTVASLYVFCHFHEPMLKSPRFTERYEMCENHNKNYGGFIFSCRVPDFIDISNRTTISVSLTKFGPQRKIKLLRVRPPEEKVKYLDLQPITPSYLSHRFEQRVPLSSNSKVDDVNNLAMPSLSSQINFSNIPLSFAICVSPLFGDISLYRFVEFMELSRLLGADHVFLYNYSIPYQLSDAIAYYTQLNMTTVLPWSLPADVTSGKIWYQGQLLAHNDCLYRTIPRFDLVSFNDLDEFIVPHNNASTWQEAFGPLLSQDLCGFSFQSAFYQPGETAGRGEKLMTSVLTARTAVFSKVRTKVMVCPWRVFEVGIHHISKQNREGWKSRLVEPSEAFLHHYRHCVPNYGMRCNSWEPDTTMQDKYLDRLKHRYQKALLAIQPSTSTQTSDSDVTRRHG